MRNCVVCFETVEDGLRYPTWCHEGERYIHKNCLLNKVAELCQEERYEKMLKYIISYEEEHRGDSWTIEYSGGSVDASWDRERIKLRTQEIKKLLDYRVIGTILSTNRNSTYALCGREVIKQFLQKSTVTLTQDESVTSKVDESIFSPVIGYDEVKKNLILSINSEKKIHWLFEGVPASSKTLFLSCIERALGEKCYYSTGSRTTGVGLTEALLLYTPLTLIIDEMDKVSQDALSVMLSVMESGDVIQTKHRSHLKVRVNTMVIGACNSSIFLPAELLSRFKPYHLYFGPYSKEEYIGVCRGYLNKFENIPADLAKYIGERTWKEFSADVREARGIARMLTKKTKSEVDEQIAFLKKYRKGGIR